MQILTSYIPPSSYFNYLVSPQDSITKHLPRTFVPAFPLSCGLINFEFLDDNHGGENVYSGRDTK